MEVVWVVMALVVTAAVAFVLIRGKRPPQAGSAGGTDSGASNQVEK
jgi:hypothetical protein